MCKPTKCRTYEESLSMTPGPIDLNQLPHVKMDLAGLSRYAKSKGVPWTELSEEEKAMFLPKPEDIDFSDQILNDLIKEGYSDDALLAEFKIRQAQIRPAVQKALDMASAAAQGTIDSESFDDIFGE